ncbi:WD40 domain-containing protein [Planktothricoides raciborskii]|uniref:WD40 repeat-containing protein SMU1 n=1 Tax=Planktothricoides raciborskii FACHB-1370 TaxID=2949576 RepID=A0ABR8EDI7_9CYAN|nr:NACHT domain-containing protein [Planktothricoides raciborskii]MBD2544924.1 NACHT domain-containing protein [Planktothricoides raciborskii FACHB-1370]MBD2582983.1 NACHT domain-containing protein [Planktothricoides raciborskii FACHB-1261]
MFGIDDVINAILAGSKGAIPLAVKQAQRQELFITILKKFNLDPEHPPADFTGVYQYALVEYGANQLGILNQEDLRLILELFRQKEIKEAFHQAFNGDNPIFFLNQVEKYIEEYALGDEIRDRRINILPELAKFSDIFIEIVKRTRNPAEVRRDQTIDRLYAEFKSAIAQLNQRFESLHSLPPGDRPAFSNSNFTRQLHDWFEALYDFEREDVWESDYFEWIIQVPARRRYDRILVRGIEGEANINDLKALEESVEKHQTDEGWLVAPSRVSQAVRDAVEGDRRLFCYTFDELIDEAVNFSGYLNWLETEVKRQKIDTLYVPLACTKEELDPKTQQSLGKSRYDQRNGWIDRYINTWLNDSAKEHLSILGEFGTGKTWFVLHYAWQAVQKYRTAKAEGNKLPRLPLVIPLRDYAKAVSVESLFSEFFFRQHDVGLPNYKAFEQLNRMGKLLLIFDGFDEMAAKVDRQKMINNFWELAKVVVPGSKAILTCRTEHFPEAKEGRDLLNAELQASTSKLIRQPPHFEVLELEKLNNEQIREVLCKREAKPETIAKIMANPELVDLARRPVMVNLILEALPEIESGKPIDLARIYLYAVRRKMERDIKTDRTFTSMTDKLYFLCELAWEMLSTDQMSLNYRLFPDRIRRCFGPVVQEQKDLDHWHYDMMGQTLLIRNADGDYSPAHRSLLEFFVAYKFAVQLGILAPDFAEIATISFADNLRETFGQAPLTKALLDLLLPMLNLEIAKQRLLDLIAATKGKTEAEVGYLGGNAATVLLKVDPTSLQNRDFSNTVILGADFTTANLRNVNFTNANLNESLFAKAFDFVLSVAFSPDGRFLATGHDNGEVRLWEVADGEQIAIYRGHSNSVRSVAISPDGNILASGSDDQTIKLWDLHSGDCLQTLPGHSNPVKSVAISPDGKILASGSYDNTIKLWDIESGECLKTLQGHSNSVFSVAISPDGNILASGSYDNTIKLWDLHSGDCLQTLPGHNNWVRSVAISPDGKTLASGSNDHTIKLWDLHSGHCLQTLPGHSDWVWSVAISPDGNILASGSVDNTIKLWNLHSGQCLQTLQEHSNSVWSVAISPDGKTLASGSVDNTIKLWDFHSGDCLQTLQGHSNSVFSVAYAPDGNILASGGSDKTIQLWDLHSGDCLQTLPGHSSLIWSVAYAPDGKTLASGSYDNTIKLWDIDSGDCLQTFEGHSNWVFLVAYAPDGNILASGSDDNTIKLWDLHSGHCLQTLRGHSHSLWSVAISPDGNILASGGSDNTIKLWDLHSGECLQTLPGHSNWVRSVVFSPDGNILASGSDDETIKLWDLHSGKCLQTLRGHSNSVWSVAISPDGNILASGSDDQTIKLWDIHSGDCLQTLRGHRSVVWSVAISPDGKTLASGSSDGTIKIWDLQSGECLKTISNKLYAGAKIAGVTGLTAAEKASLIALGAVEF